MRYIDGCRSVDHINCSLVNVIKHDQSDRTSRGMTKGLLQENSTPKTCIGDAVRLWNKAPETIRSAKSLAIAKKMTKVYCKSLPI